MKIYYSSKILDLNLKKKVIRFLEIPPVYMVNCNQ